MVNGQPFLLGYGSVAAANYGNMQSPTNYKTPPPGKRERTKFSPQQLCYLENQFEKCQYPQGPQREAIARQLSLTDTKVQIWFKNRRAKVRQKKKFEDELQKAHQNHQMKRESTDEELRMPNMENGGTDQEEDNKCRMPTAVTAHNSINPMMLTNNSQPHSATHTPTLLQPIQPTAQANELMPQLSSAMPFMFAQQNIADLTGIKLEPLAANDASSLLTDTTGMSNIGAASFAQTNPGWVNWYGGYPNTNFGFPSYAPYSSNSAAVSTPYEPFAPNYYMNTMNTMPRADLTKFQ